MTAVGDARKRHTATPSADAGVWVRAELVEKLREAVRVWDASELAVVARALLEAVERDSCSPHGQPNCEDCGPFPPRSAAGEGEATPETSVAASNTGVPACDRVSTGTNRRPGGEPSSEAATEGPPWVRETAPHGIGGPTELLDWGEDAPVPVSDEAEATWEAYRATWDFADENPRPLEIAFLAGFRAARGGKGNSDE